MAAFNTGQTVPTKVPEVVVDGGLRAGRHRFQLTVVDDNGLESDPVILTVVVRAPIPGPGPGPVQAQGPARIRSHLAHCRRKRKRADRTRGASQPVTNQAWEPRRRARRAQRNAGHEPGPEDRRDECRPNRPNRSRGRERRATRCRPPAMNRQPGNSRRRRGEDEARRPGQRPRENRPLRQASSPNQPARHRQSGNVAKRRAGRLRSLPRSCGRGYCEANMARPGEEMSAGKR